MFLPQLEQPIDVAHEGLITAKRNGKITILNPAPATELLKEVFEVCDYITPKTEAEAITGLPVRNEVEAEQPQFLAA